MTVPLTDRQGIAMDMVAVGHVKCGARCGMYQYVTLDGRVDASRAMLRELHQRDLIEPAPPGGPWAAVRMTEAGHDTWSAWRAAKGERG